MSKLVTGTILALSVLAASVANAAPSAKGDHFNAAKFFAERQLSGN